jgi:hypothetical protein
MINEHKKIFAAASASFCVRSSMAAAFVCLGLIGASVAQADPDGQPRREQQQSQQQSQQHQAPSQPPSQPQGGAPRNDQQPARGGDARQLDPRAYEARAEEQRRQMQEASRNAEMNRRVGRMTPDERRDLRRQINEVSQDLYANPPRR